MSPDILFNDLYRRHDRHFLDAVFDTVFNDLQVLEVIYDDQHKVSDLKYILHNKPASRDGQYSVLANGDGIDKSPLFHQLLRVIETGEPLDDTFQYKKEDNEHWVHIKAQKFGHYLILSREDLTASKKAEGNLQLLNRSLSEKNRELEMLGSELKTFNTLAATEYNETLRSVYTCLEFIISNDAKNLSDPGKANVRRAQAAIQKLKLLTDDIVSFSKITTEEPPSSVDLNELIGMVLNNMANKITENNAVVTYEGLPVIQGYPLLLSILFTHLIDNAVKFRKEDIAPQITISFLQQEGKVIENPVAEKERTYAVISIADNGIGLDIRDAEKIFTMFYRLNERGKGKGSGIGLAICKKIMDLHGGFIVAECAPECTTFRCYFPSEN